MKSLLYESPDSILGWPISDNQKVWYCYLIPAIVGCCVCIVHIAADIVLTYEYLLEENYFYGFLTCVFLCSPALGCLVFTLTSLELIENKAGCEVIIWIGNKTLQHIFFPIWAMYGYAERIFWSIEALRTSGGEREGCLWNASKTRPIELYHFLRAYFQAIPQLLIQIHLILQENSLYNTDRVQMQVVSIIMSLTVAAMTTMSYHHYESQKLLGRQYPWSRKHGRYVQNLGSESNDEDDGKEPINIEENMLFTVSDSQKLQSINQTENTDCPQGDMSSSEIDIRALPESDKYLYERCLSSGSECYSPRIKYFIDNDSERGSNYAPSTWENNSIISRSSTFKLQHKCSDLSDSTSPPSYAPPAPVVDYDELNEDYAQLSSPSSYAPSTPNSQKSKEIEKHVSAISKVSSASKPPDYPAPVRKVSNNDNTNYTEGNRESLSETVYSSTLPHSGGNAHDIVLPRRLFPQQGRRPDDAIGKLILYMFWLCFLTARILSISVFGVFFGNAIICLGFIHYLIMTIIMLVYAKTRSMNRIVLYSFLGYIYVFCLIEFRIKFQRFYQTFFVYFIFVYTENLILTIIWCMEDWESWWFSYLLWTIILSSVFGAFCSFTYVKILKPSKKILYTAHRNYIFK